jgi:signal transduction histidine kinase
VNEAALVYLRRDRDGVIGRSFAAVIGCDLPPFWADRDRAAAQKRVTLRRADGGSIDAVIAFDRGGCVVALIERAVEERERDAWTAMIAHDLRQPLTLIRLCEATLASGAENGSMAEKASQTIRGAVQRMTAIIDELLELGTLQAQQLELEKRAIAPAALIATVVERAPALDRVAVTVRAPRDLPAVALDPVRVERVLDNLLDNAFKYGAPGPIEVSASAEDGELTIAVSSPGELADDELAHMFTRFYRSRAAVKSKAPGVGLGLAISRGIVEAHGGRIWATSSGGRVTVGFALPV